MPIFKRTNATGGFKTQKANGLRATHYVHGAMEHYTRACLTHSDIDNSLVASAADILANPALAFSELLEKYCYTFPMFARPCPTVPRHGFVDSRAVVDTPDIVRMCVDAVTADANAEIIVMRQLSGAASAILTKGALAVGPGNDGATSGRSVTLYGPLLVAAAGYKFLIDKAGIANGDVAYVEAVENDAEEWSLVQVRGGPEVPVCEDYVPKAITVKTVLTATYDYDLLRWEKDVAAGAKTPGFVVDASSMSLTSHFAVHAVVNKVPVITSHAPKKGDKLKPVGVDWKGADYVRLADYINQVDYLLSNPGTAAIVESGNLAQISVGALHLAGQPVPATDAQLRLTAFGVVGAIKLMSMACIGEARHLDQTRGIRSARYSERGNVKVDKQRAVIALSVMQTIKADHAEGRGAYYGICRRVPLSALGSIMFPVGLVFRDLSWDNSYGGDAWAAIVAGCRTMIRALQKFSARPNHETWAKVVELWNEAIHREHNGGAPALSKFGVSCENMNELAEAPLACVTSMSPSEAWRAFGDPFEELLAKIGADKVVPIHHKACVPAGVHKPVFNPAGGSEEKRSTLKGVITIAAATEAAGQHPLRFSTKDIDGYTGIPSGTTSFYIKDLLPAATYDKILKILREYGGAIPAACTVSTTVDTHASRTSSRFLEHIQMLMFFAGVARLDLPQTTTSRLDMIQLKVGLGAGFKSTKIAPAMKTWMHPAELDFHSDENERRSRDEDERLLRDLFADETERLDW